MCNTSFTLNHLNQSPFRYSQGIHLDYGETVPYMIINASILQAENINLRSIRCILLHEARSL